MKFKSQIATQVSGSVGGTTYSHNKGGLYMRSRSIPTNPGTGPQTTIRAILQGLSQQWGSALSVVQRSAWADYAAGTPVIDALGSSIHLSGQNMFIKCNCARIQAGLTVILPAPSTMGLATLTAPVLTGLVSSTKVLSFTINNTNTWATAVGGALLVYSSRQQNPGVKFFKGPYQYAFRINGAVSPPANSQTGTGVFPVAVGQTTYYRMVAVNADGRVSAEFRGSAVGA